MANLYLNKIIDLLRLKIKGHIVIDDFFPDEICTQLRERIHNTKYYNFKYWDYNALEFDNNSADSSLEYISDKYIVPKIPLAKKYIRSWCFVYDNVARGVRPHIDQSFINVNIWITPDECVEDHNKNGLRLYNKKAHVGKWKDGEDTSSWQLYRRDDTFVTNYLKDSKYDIIPYKYNRAVVFEGKTFHSTDDVHMKPGNENKRINYTFLYS